jgi:hypothetical protein
MERGQHAMHARLDLVYNQAATHALSTKISLARDTQSLQGLPMTHARLVASLVYRPASLLGFGHHMFVGSSSTDNCATALTVSYQLLLYFVL